MRFLFNKIKDFFIELKMFNDMMNYFKKEIQETM